MGFESHTSEPHTPRNALLQALENWKKNWKEEKNRKRRERWDKDHSLDAERRRDGGYTVNGTTIYPDNTTSTPNTEH